MPRIDDPPTCLYVAMERKGGIIRPVFFLQKQGEQVEARRSPSEKSEL
jgi:hypothetical protein